MDRPVSRQTENFRRELVCDWSYRWTPERRAVDGVTVPAGTIYNPSIPGVAHSVIPVSRAMIASAPHDDLYRSAGGAEQSTTIQRTIGAATFAVPTVGRRYADRLFRQIMIDAGVARWRVALAYRAVRAVGWIAWNDPDRRRDGE
jgi:hypothetical protein